MKSDKEKTVEEGSFEIPLDILPPCVNRFIQRKEDSFKSDADYFEAILACEAARWRARGLSATTQDVFSTMLDSYAKPSSTFFNEGRVLREELAGLHEKLDQKRRSMVSSMESPPLIEEFLDKMKATEAQRRFFYYAISAASGALSSMNLSGRDVYAYAHADEVYVSPAEAYTTCSDFLTLDEFMSLVDVDSLWVTEQIYERCHRPIGRNLVAMEKNTLRCFMGSAITASQYHEIESPCLQKVLLEKKSFLETEAGKEVMEAHSRQPGDAQDSALGDTEKKPDNDLARRVAKSAAGAGQIFEAIAGMHHEVSPVEDNDIVSPVEDKGIDRNNGNSNFGPYANDLEFLEDQFRLVDTAMKLRRCIALVDDSDDGANDNDPHRNDDPLTGRRMSKEERVLKNTREAAKLEIKQKKLEFKVETRIRATGPDPPRFEQLSTLYNLGDFDRFVLLELIREIIDPRLGDIFERSRMMMDPGGGTGRDRVDYFIGSFSQSLEEKMRCRTFFYKSGTLVKNGIIIVSGQDFKSDLNMCTVVLDRRMFDYLIGWETEFSELVDGSHLYTPDENIDNVILPAEIKDQICERVLHFETVKKKYEELEIPKKITYGLGQVLLFYGSSGTGKTMMANAIAAKLEKSVLLVNFPTLGQNTPGAIIKFLFREAEIKNAILFFDECESLFRSREKGGSAITTCLTELERFDGMCILATNRAYDLDEAMYRRISLAVEFKKPDHILRERIWKILHPEKLALHLDVDLKELARKYELTGGFIKNVWLSSVSIMVSRNQETVCQADLEQAAGEQLIGRLANSDEFDRQVVPTCGTKSVVASDKVTALLKDIVDHRKAQAVLFGQWGFQKLHRAQSGVSALFHGPPGTGKTMAAEAIGFDTGSPLMVVNTAELMSKYVGETGKNIVAVFREANQKGAVLVFDEGEGLFGARSQGGDSSTGRHDTLNVGLLLQHVENFSGVCIVITNHRDVIDEAFFRRFHYVLEFELPGPGQREKLWGFIVPKECPLAKDVKLSILANRYEMCGGDIKSALLRAASRAALRLKDKDRVVSMKDLELSCKEEVSKRSNENPSFYM